jgi:hypothetical protein
LLELNSVTAFRLATAVEKLVNSMSDADPQITFDPVNSLELVIDGLTQPVWQDLANWFGVGTGTDKTHNGISSFTAKIQNPISRLLSTYLQIQVKDRACGQRIKNQQQFEGPTRRQAASQANLKLLQDMTTEILNCVNNSHRVTVTRLNALQQLGGLPQSSCIEYNLDELRVVPNEPDLASPADTINEAKDLIDSMNNVLRKMCNQLNAVNSLLNTFDQSINVYGTGQVMETVDPAVAQSIRLTHRALEVAAATRFAVHTLTAL